MTLHAFKKVSNICVALSTLLITNNVYAIAEQVLAQSSDTIEYGLIAIVALFVVVFVMMIIFKVGHKKATHQLAENQRILQQNTFYLDNFQVGMVHVNHAGEIQYCNKLAAYFLGNRPENLTGKGLSTLFNKQYSEQIEKGINAKVQSKEQLIGPVKERDLLLEFAPQKGNIHNIASIISIVDFTAAQSKIASLTNSLDFNNQLLDSSQIGQLEIDLSEKTFRTNRVFSKLLANTDEQIQGDLKQFEQYISQQTQFAWIQGLKDLERGQPIDLVCKLDAHEGNVFVKVIGLPLNLDEKGKAQNAHMTVTNISPQVALKEQLAASKQIVKGMLSSMSHPTLLLDENSLVVACNTAFELIFNTSTENLRQQPAKQLSVLPTEIQDLMPQGQSSSMVYSASVGSAKEMSLTLATGEQRTLKIKIQSFRDESGNPAGSICLMEDVTELKQTKALLEHERQRFANIINKAPLGIAMIDEDDGIVQANSALTQRLNITEKELKKISFYQLFNDPKNSGKAAKKLHKNGRLEGFHADLKGSQQQLHPSELNIELFDRKKQHYLCWISDISDEQYQQDKFESLLLHSSMPMAVLAEDGFNKLNPAACDFFSVEDQEDLFGLYPYSQKLNDEESDLESLQHKIEHIKQDGQALSITWQHRLDKKKLPCQATFVPMFKGQDFDSILCIWTDLRAIKKADQERLEAINLHQAAERLIVEKQQLLESSQDQLASKVRSLSDTQSKLKAAEEDITDKTSELSSLQEAHDNITAHLNQLQEDYQQSRDSLASSEQANEELAKQLEQTSKRVNGLEKQRNQIADELQYSNKKYKDAQKELAESEETARTLETERQEQQQKMLAFEGEISQLKTSIHQKDKQISDVNGQISSLQSKLSSSSQASEKLRQLLINQRKASEKAEQQRRDLEQSCFVAQSELSNKARHIDHLQYEMDKFEEMSKQQKGDMEKQQTLLQQELENKQRQLQATQGVLNQAQRQSEQDKAEKQQQQQRLQQLQDDLMEVERRSEQQQQKIAEADKHWAQQQQKLQQELHDKQQKLQDTQRILQQQELQVEAEKSAKAEQQKVFEKLQQELAEMERRSELQQQQKNDEAELRLQEQQLQWQQELEQQQQKLQRAEQNLNQAKQQTEAEKVQQRELMQRLQSELVEMEKRSEQQQKQIVEEANRRWKDKQDELQKALQRKQQKLLETEQALQRTAQQTETEKAAKQQQQKIFEQLQSELVEMEQRSSQQQREMQESDQQWQQRQEALKQEVEAKQAKLKQTQQQLDENQRQADKEKRERLEQQQKLDQLKSELSDVESRATKQKEMLQGSDEQWRQHHAEIEQQKKQLQQSLRDAEQQNKQMQEKLQHSLQELARAESQVNDTQSGEQKLQLELEQAKREAQELQGKLKQQELQELKLQQQLAEQQNALQNSEQNVQKMQNEQQQLANQLQSIQAEYDHTKASLSAQDNNQSELTEKLQQLEQELINNKHQIANKETELERAQKQLESSQAKLQVKEKALVAAHKEELKQVQEQRPDSETLQTPEFAKLEMPRDPHIWFDLLPFLQKNPPKQSLAVDLGALMNELEDAMETMDKAVTEDNASAILTQGRKLAHIARKVNSNPLDDVATRLEADFRQGEVDSISIFWPSVKESIMTTLRVIYSHLNK
ncbi:PAS domain-containing protein [Aliiglaciecola sp. 3_MG-2023]|uniref:PAS domain-containing protein n=1 Tax=Aliiglaciecola sp. 3_MG-2023 TaxID=3062644 RepID=UPI0026E2625B|nr:PAS domain-containing protein [Aliiglaciecola sp. 3_MG-2023]MDO6692715.1 PAS domain-containing protein [Aliiglaciecola sp. 3_MG-2023]